MKCSGDGLWAGTARELCHASRADTARKTAHSVVPGSKARHKARSGTAWQGQWPVKARLPPCRSSLTSCQAMPGQPVGHL